MALAKHLTPASNTGVVFNNYVPRGTKRGFMLLNSCKFDWYSCTLDVSPDSLVSVARSFFPNYDYVIGRAKLGYEFCDCLLNPDGSPFLSVMWGGGNGSRVYAVATGSNAVAFSSFIRKYFPFHYLTRCDLAVDFDEDLAWVTLSRCLKMISEETKVSLRYFGDQGKDFLGSASTDSGRTLYLGSRSSASMFRLYEKGKKEGGGASPNWVRLELEFKPQYDEAKTFFASASPAEIYSSSKIGRTMLKAFNENQFSVLPASKSSVSDFERALFHVKQQYRNTFLELLDLCGGDRLEFANRLLQVDDFKTIINKLEYKGGYCESVD